MTTKEARIITRFTDRPAEGNADAKSCRFFLSPSVKLERSRLLEQGVRKYEITPYTYFTVSGSRSARFIND